MIIGFTIIFGVLFLDQMTKYIASHAIMLDHTKVIIPKILEFSHIENRGASFGILEGKQYLFMIITIAALALFGYLFSSSDYKNKKVYSLSIALFISGTLGNAIDRVFNDGAVIDFIHLPFLGSVHSILNFTFNVADIALNFAVVLFLIDILFLEGKRTKSQGNPIE